MQILSSENYFGKYGRVKKVMISQKGGLLKRSDRKVTHSAYFTYENEIDSSLALIVRIHQFLEYVRIQIWGELLEILLRL